jgi:DNA polymerase III epsilon subunit-like protein
MTQNPNWIIVFDTETTGFSPVKNEIVQLSYFIYDTLDGKIIHGTNPGEDLVNIIGKIPPSTTQVHGITKEITIDKRPIKEHIDDFIYWCNQCSQFVGHNIAFDIKMIIGQIHKMHIDSFDIDETQKYQQFLERFQLIGGHLPDDAFCTMIESTGICAKLRGDVKHKKMKLMEVHKLLFNQDVGGQLHNALVDISVTLRVFLKLTKDIDICISPLQSEISQSITQVKTNYDICSLIQPIPIKIQPDMIEYSGEIVTGLKVLPNNEGLQEEKIMVESIAKKLANEFIKNVQKKAIENVSNQITPYSLCTNISICRAIIKSGKKMGETCSRHIKYGDFCGIHTPKITQIVPDIDNTQVIQKPYMNNSESSSVPMQVDELSIRPVVIEKTKPTSTYYDSLMASLKLNKTNKVAPVGGNRRTKKNRKSRTRKLKYRNKRQTK